MVRYVERNPLRAGLVPRAENWPWSSLSLHPSGPPLEPGPVPRDSDWTEFVNAPMTEAKVEAVQLSLRRQRPLGTATWTQTTAETLGLGFTLRNPGRPRGGNADDKTTQTT